MLSVNALQKPCAYSKRVMPCRRDSGQFLKTYDSTANWYFEFQNGRAARERSWIEPVPQQIQEIERLLNTVIAILEFAGLSSWWRVSFDLSDNFIHDDPAVLVDVCAVNQRWALKRCFGSEWNRPAHANSPWEIKIFADFLVRQCDRSPSDWR